MAPISSATAQVLVATVLLAALQPFLGWDTPSSVTWQVTDASGLGPVGVVVTRNGGTVFTSAAASGGFNFDSFGPGVYVLTLSATDADGDWSGDARSVSATRSGTRGKISGS